MTSNALIMRGENKAAVKYNNIRVHAIIIPRVAHAHAQCRLHKCKIVAHSINPFQCIGLFIWNIENVGTSLSSGTIILFTYVLLHDYTHLHNKLYERAYLFRHHFWHLHGQILNLSFWIWGHKNHTFNVPMMSPYMYMYMHAHVQPPYLLTPVKQTWNQSPFSKWRARETKEKLISRNITQGTSLVAKVKGNIAIRLVHILGSCIHKIVIHSGVHAHV